MKLVNLKNPVMASWMREQGARLDAPPFLSGAIEARKLLELLSVKKEPLASLTKGHNGGIFNGPQFSRTYVDDPEHGVPFVGSSDMLQADLSQLPLLRKQNAYSPGLSYLRLEEGMTLISCSGTIGRMVYVRPEMAGMWSSQHVMKVVPDPDHILPGYLYAFLSSKFGAPLVVGGTYGAIIQHIEPYHIAELPVPRLGEKLEASVHKLAQEAAEARTRASETAFAAIEALNKAAGLMVLSKTHSPTPYCATWVSSRLVTKRLDAFFHSHYHTEAVKDLKTRGTTISVGKFASAIVEPNRFKRIPINDENLGVPFFGTSALMRIDPDPTYFLPRRQSGIEQYIVNENTVLLPRSGQLAGIIGTSVLPFGKVVGGAVTEDAIRVVCRSASDAGFLYVALTSEHGSRQLKSRASGSSIPHLDVHQVAQVLVPDLGKERQLSIGNMGTSVAMLRGTAIEKEAQARALVESAINEAS